MNPHVARQMWARFEPIHTVTYFTPEALSAYAEAGLRGYWRGYFGGRMAPLGPIDAPLGVATAYGFAPAMVERALPDVWSRATPAAALTARVAGATAALTRLLADVDLSALDEMADLAEAAADLLDPAGHALGAANMALPRSTDPLARLWQVATTIREHRGDGHVAALVAHGFSGVESAVWRTEPEARAEYQSYRGWTDEEWDAAIAALTERGWLGADGAATEAGTAAYAAVEAATDRDAVRVWAHFGEQRTERLKTLLSPLATMTFTAIPRINPVHLPDPDTI
ncbi:hypothetical protein F4553_007710 [Allocatelliglobosispora scoriae]|uniref:SalK n=2 Tax=Allocatelliglobosispora scoriae TaxID=643052 RepID=A0A841C2Z1_9ACTN|nr:hypothetical protein [Allocatelliglobosispora scoriae]MBB5874276.1 hypothetical protein [Allocatelliglobosispora scoriae]